MSELTIAKVAIRRDTAGRFCLNDLHKAAGGAKRHSPNEWLRNKQTKRLIAEVAKPPVQITPDLFESDREFPVAPVVSEAVKNPSTYVVDDLVYAYAMWISPRFNLQVIRAYKALVKNEYVDPLTQVANYWFSRRPHWPAIRARALAGQTYREIAAALARSIGSVANAVRRMIAVGLLSPSAVALSQRGPARLAAQRRIPGWGQQMVLPLEVAA